LCWQIAAALDAARFRVTAMMTPTSIIVDMRKCPSIRLRGFRPQLLIDVVAERSGRLRMVDVILTHSMKRSPRDIAVLK
jgi:hypothetical protein